MVPVSGGPSWKGLNACLRQDCQRGRERKRWGQQETIAECSGRDPEATAVLPVPFEARQKRTTRASSQALVITPRLIDSVRVKPNLFRAVKAQLRIPSGNFVSSRRFRVCKPACGFVKIGEFRRDNLPAALAATIVVLNKFG